MPGPDTYDLIAAKARAVHEGGRTPRRLRLGPDEVAALEAAGYTGATLDVPIFGGDEPGFRGLGEALPNSYVAARVTLEVEQAPESPCLEVLA
jgi:hypothetical protein